MLPSIYTFALIWAARVTAQNVVDKLSFGHKGTLSDNSFHIPGWSSLGEGFVPQLYSDKIILTPPYGGNKRGAVWAEEVNTATHWTANIEFRAGGVEHGKGNMAIWYVKDGAHAVSTSSIYTVGKFDGLALFFDVSNGIQRLRAFLNDGNVNYKSHGSVDSLAFGHCDYNYRNLGRPSKVQVRVAPGSLEVLIDDRQCFKTKVNLPSGYGFGLTSASSDPPDSFEVFKFELSTASGAAFNANNNNAAGTSKQQQEHQQFLQGNQNSIPTNQFTSDNAAYQNFEQRLNLIEKSIKNMFEEINRHTKAEEARYNEILNLLKSGQSTNAAGAGAAIGNLESRLNNLDRSLSSLTTDLKNTLRHGETLDKIGKQLEDTHESVTNQLPGKMREYVQHHTPRIGFIVFSFMLFQSCCLALLLWQKYRKGTMPKKFL